MMRKTKLFIIDDHQLVIDGLMALLGNEPQFEIVGYTSQPKEAIELVKSLEVDIVMTDINMPGMSGVELTRGIKKVFPSIRVLALSMFGDRPVIKEMIDAGISGYILKNTGKQELLEALEKLAQGETFFGMEVTRELMRSFKESDEAAHLTNREVEIVRLIEGEYNNKQIAERLFISERTVETHRKNIFRKTGTQSIVGLLKYAYDHKII